MSTHPAGSGRFAFAKTRAGELIAFQIDRPGLVPSSAVDIPQQSSPAPVPQLDRGRAGLWLLAQNVEREPGVYGLYPYDTSPTTTDSRDERPPVDLEAIDHHLLVLDGEPGPRLRAALAAETVEQPYPGTYVTREPVALSVAQQWTAEATLVCAFPGSDQADKVLYNAYIREFRDDALRFIRVATDAIPVAALPPEWVEALASAALTIDTPGERLVLTDVCRDVRALGPDGERPADATDLEAEFHRCLARPMETSDPWPDGVVQGHGELLPESGAGRTVVLSRRLDYPATITLFVFATGAGWVGYLLLGLDFESASLAAKIAYVGVVGLATVALALQMHLPWRVRIERDRVVCAGRSLPITEAETALRGVGWRVLAATRARAQRAGWRRAQLAVREWLLHTARGRAHADAQQGAAFREPSARPPFEAFAVDARGVRFLGEAMWHCDEYARTVEGSTYAWSIKPRTLREAAPGAELVLLPRGWNGEHPSFEYNEEPIYLASGSDGVHELRGAVTASGGQVADA